MNKILPLPSVDRIRQIYDFSADTGKFWNRRLKRFGGTQRPSGQNLELFLYGLDFAEIPKHSCLIDDDGSVHLSP